MIFPGEADVGATEEPPTWGSTPSWGTPPEPAYRPPGPGVAAPPVTPSPFGVVEGVRREGRRVVGAGLYGLAGLTGAFFVAAGLARAVLALTGRPVEVDGSTPDAVAATALLGGLAGLGAGVLFGARRRNPAGAVPRPAARRLGAAVGAASATFLACVPLAVVAEDAMLTVFFTVGPLVTGWFARPYRRTRAVPPVPE